MTDSFYKQSKSPSLKATPTRSTQNGDGPYLGWLFSLLGGGAVLAFVHFYSGIRLGTAITSSFVVTLYVLYLLFWLRSHETEDRDHHAHQVYILGFTFTLFSLFLVFLPYLFGSADNLLLSNVIGSFAAALTSTMAGIVGRSIIASRGSPALSDIEEQFGNLSTKINDLIVGLNTAIRSLEKEKMDYTEKAFQQIHQVFNRMSDELTEAVQHVKHQSASTFATMTDPFKGIASNAKQLEETLDRLVDATATQMKFAQGILDSTKESIDDANNLVNSTKQNTEIVVAGLHELLDDFRNFSYTVKDLSKSLENAPNVVNIHVDRIKTMSENLESSFNDIVRHQKMMSEASAGAQKTVSETLRELSECIERTTGAINESHAGTE